jgi:uncharacterized protein YpmS
MIFKNWAFRLFIYHVILNIYIAILFLNRAPALGVRIYSSYERSITVFEIMAAITFLLGIIFSIVSVFKKEERDYKFYISSFGFGLLIVLAIISKFLFL